MKPQIITRNTQYSDYFFTDVCARQLSARQGVRPSRNESHVSLRLPAFTLSDSHLPERLPSCVRIYRKTQSIPEGLFALRTLLHLSHQTLLSDETREVLFRIYRYGIAEGGEAKDTSGQRRSLGTRADAIFLNVMKRCITLLLQTQSLSI